MSTIALDFLTHLEEREARLLTWGFVDGGFALDELELLADEFVLENDDTGALTGADLVTDLRDRALLLDVDDGIAVRHRSRMAETVRLLARLRQLFPKHQGAGWARARTLVADYRLMTRAREYPRRDVSIDDALSDLTAAGVATGERLAALRGLLEQRDDGKFSLSRFQVDATREILAGLDARRSSGTIVGVGTGAGKTLAFYLPALSHVVSASGGEGTRVLAIYPRIELLRDQFAETYQEARRLDGIGRLGRPIRIGALYGGTPEVPGGALRFWKSRGEDRICPYMLCPTCREGSLVWARNDIENQVAVLTCSACSAQVGSDHLVLTRSQMLREPPDVLFTTTEMLNRTLTNGRMRHLIGVGRGAMPIDVVLLDEVHTYEGTMGAHVAGVLRRWRHARRSRVHFVGLSATLREAGAFFSSLTGLGEHQISAVQPRPADLEREGQEYMVAVRSDPHSGASVLSTTIQTAMLMQRALDPMTGGLSGGAFGSRLFAFTDDLDVTNRLFFDLLDAEGLNSWGRPEKEPLAALRAPTGDDLPARRAAGQAWDALERIGHRLDGEANMRIGRTTSQDADVDRSASAIVATASLEVGFNDDRVGAALQHKSPHDTAAFLQRKGRAGRPRGMRPWTIIVLSDFGRDRATYESYERLFDPELAPRTLPVANPAVVRMQAVFATLDWLAQELGEGAQIWRLLERPAGGGTFGERDRERQIRIADRLERVLVDPGSRELLAAHLRRALWASEEEVSAILWDPPRPLLTAVLPTAIRRLRTTWRHLELGPQRDLIGDGPLPEFVVSRLFGDLALPEITIVTPPQTKNDEERREPMRAVQALNAYAPGRVSHRLTIAHRHARHWVEPPSLNADGHAAMDVHAFSSEFEELGVFAAQAQHPVRVVRPLTIPVAVPPSEVLSSSHGRLKWNAEMVPSGGTQQEFEPPAASRLAGLIERVAFYTHGGLCHVEVRRWATEAEIETHALSGSKRGTVGFIDPGRGDQPIAIGLAMDVDAVAVDVNLPKALVTGHELAPAHLRDLRVEYWRGLIRQASVVQRLLGVFNAERLSEAVLLAIIDHATSSGIDLEKAYVDLCEGNGLRDAVSRVLKRREAGDEGEGDASRGAEDVLDALSESAIVDAIDGAVPALWDNPSGAWDAWASRRLASTVGAAVHAALGDLCPEYDLDELVVDLEPDIDSGRIRVWLSEQTVGGGGLLQEALRRIGDRPRRFFDLIARVAEPSLGEMVDAELTGIARGAKAGTSLFLAIERVREARSQTERTEAFDVLLSNLHEIGALVCHPVVSAMSVRLLRPGATDRTDQALVELIDRWEGLEQSIGIGVDLRGFAELEARTDRFERSAGLSPPPDDPVGWRVGQITGMLWQRGHSVRSQALATRNPFADMPAPDPLLLRSCLGERARPIPVDSLGKLFERDGSLARDGEAEIDASIGEPRELRRSLLLAAATPVEAGPLLHFPRVDGVQRDARGFRARLVLDLVGE